MMKGFSPEVTELMQEESALQTQYQSLLASAQIEYQGGTYNLSQMGPFTQNKEIVHAVNLRNLCLCIRGSFYSFRNLADLFLHLLQYHNDALSVFLNNYNIF